MFHCGFNNKAYFYREFAKKIPSYTQRIPKSEIKTLKCVVHCNLIFDFEIVILKSYES